MTKSASSSRRTRCYRSRVAHELVTIAFSHYCEKARWALDRHRVPYTEHAYLPLLHMPPVALRTIGRAGRSDKHSTRFSTPLFSTHEGELITDSSDIVRWVDRHHAKGALYPSEEVAAFERELGDELGPHTRRVAYFHLLPDRALVTRMAAKNTGAAQALAFRAVAPAVIVVLRRALGIDRARAERSEAKVWAMAHRVAERIADGRPYLFGESFTAADLTFAALMAPLVAPPEYGAHLPAVEELSAEIRETIYALREHPAGALAMRLYREERRTTI